jgi:TRAP-type C4-dicarboxylate transport system permease small subunit
MNLDQLTVGHKVALICTFLFCCAIIWAATSPQNKLVQIFTNTIAPHPDPKLPREINSRRLLTYLLIPVFIGIIIRGFFFFHPQVLAVTPNGAVPGTGPVSQFLTEAFPPDKRDVLETIALLLAALIGIGAGKDILSKKKRPPTDTGLGMGGATGTL